MRIHNVRIGHATNSSSSHSIVLLGKDQRLFQVDPNGDAQFGWDNFTLTNPAAKRCYLAQTLFYSLSKELPIEVAQLCVREWLGLSWDPEGYIDHQSVIDLPCRFSHPIVDAEFLADFAAFLDRDDVAILGGNDNQASHPDLAFTETVPLGLPLEVPHGHLTCRKEAEGWWTIFNRQSGARFFIDFRDPMVAFAPVSTRTPMLVDLKITDYCPYGCKFCYQGSTEQGAHATASDLEMVYDALAEMKVFEVAIGGGEPTLHPEFVQILTDLRKHGIVPNFTTRNLGWIKDGELRTQILPLIGGFAFSTERPEEVSKVVGTCLAFNVPLDKLNIQFIIGVEPNWTLNRMVDVCQQHGVRLTLLGYKSTGRGEHFKTTGADAVWLDVLFKQRDAGQIRSPIGIDTVLAAKHCQGLEQGGVSKLLFHTEEGTFSMYWDAVNRKVGPSSYSPSQMKSLPQWFQTEQVLDLYRSLPGPPKLPVL